MENFRHLSPAVLPYAELEPERVAHHVRVAMAVLGNDDLFIKHSGYSRDTIRRATNNPESCSDRTRSNLLRYARAILQEQKQTFFDMAQVEPIEVPAAVFPYRVVQTVTVPTGYPYNIRNPHDPGPQQRNLLYHLWSCLYLSVRPSNSPFIHLFGGPLQASRAYVDQWPISDRHWLGQLLNGPCGHLNMRSTMANPTLLEKFAQLLQLRWNVWGQALWIDEPDLISEDATPATDTTEGDTDVS